MENNILYLLNILGDIVYTLTLLIDVFVHLVYALANLLIYILSHAEDVHNVLYRLRKMGSMVFP